MYPDSAMAAEAPQPRVVLAQLSDSMSEQLLERVLPPEVQLLAVSNLDWLVAMAKRKMPSVIAVDFETTTMERLGTALIKLQQCAPSVPRIVRVVPQQGVGNHLLAIARVQPTAIVVEGYDDFASVIESHLECGTLASAVCAVKPLVIGQAPLLLQPLIEYYFRNLSNPISTESTAVALGASPRGITHLTRRCGWQSPAKLLTWCRVLVASRLLQESSQPQRKIAADVGLALRTLRLAFKRTIGSPPATLPREVAWEVAREKFESELSLRK